MDWITLLLGIALIADLVWIGKQFYDVGMKVKKAQEGKLK